MISALSWIPKGASKAILEVAEPPSQKEIDGMLKTAALERSGEIDEEEEDDENMEDAAVEKADEIANALAVAEALGRGSKKRKEGGAFDDITNGLQELDMDNYDEEDADIELFSSAQGDLYYPSNDMDPYLKNKDEDEDSEELEDIAVKPTDSLLVCARTDDEVNLLEVYLLEESDDGETNMYVHHEVVISEFPLCTAWLDCPLKGGEKGNFIAIGSMGPAIEIWDLDIMDAVEPYLVLGGEEKTKKKKKKKKASVKYVEGSHTDSVLGLAWNKEFRNILASASADRQVKIWDVSVGKCNITMEHHTDKVQSVAWNHHAPQVLLSGSYDHSIVMKDGRMPTHTGYKWLVTADVESLAWDPHSEYSFVVSLEDGTIRGFDIRAATSNQNAESKPRFTLHAHDKAVSTISYNPSVPNLLATGSTDKTVKLWDLTNSQPSCVTSRQPKLGGVFSISFSEDSPFLLAMGGSKGKMEVWDTLSDAGVSKKFGNFSQTNRSKPAS